MNWQDERFPAEDLKPETGMVLWAEESGNVVAIVGAVRERDGIRKLYATARRRYGGPDYGCVVHFKNAEDYSANAESVAQKLVEMAIRKADDIRNERIDMPPLAELEALKIIDRRSI